MSELRHEVLQLTIQNEKLRQESQQLAIPGQADGKTPDKASVCLQGFVGNEINYI